MTPFLFDVQLRYNASHIYGYLSISSAISFPGRLALSEQLAYSYYISISQLGVEVHT